MLHQQFTHTSVILDYFQKGEQPSLLIHSGLHGDEHSIIPLVQRAITQFEPQLPDFIYVPRVSPGAVAAGTRSNGRGLDLNRSFVPDAQEPEVLANQALVSQHHFSLLISFHEDTNFDGFYLYDSHYPYHRHQFHNFSQNLKQANLPLYTGLDDPSDPSLGYTVVNGHALWTITTHTKLNGTFDDWAFRHKIIDRLVMPEIPSRWSTQQKQVVINHIFTDLILPSFT